MRKNGLGRRTQLLTGCSRPAYSALKRLADHRTGEQIGQARRAAIDGTTLFLHTDAQAWLRGQRLRASAQAQGLELGAQHPQGTRRTAFGQGPKLQAVFHAFDDRVEALQLQIYALAWRAATGRLPDEVSLRFLDTGRVATVPVEPKRIEKARQRIAEAAEGIQTGSMEAKPDLMNCTYCAYRELCPSSKAPAGRPA